MGLEKVFVTTTSLYFLEIRGLDRPTPVFNFAINLLEKEVKPTTQGKVRNKGESQRTKCEKQSIKIHVPGEEGQELIRSSNLIDHQVEKNPTSNNIIVLGQLFY